MHQGLPQVGIHKDIPAKAFARGVEKLQPTSIPVLNLRLPKAATIHHRAILSIREIHSILVASSIKDLLRSHRPAVLMRVNRVMGLNLHHMRRSLLSTNLIIADSSMDPTSSHNLSKAKMNVVCLAIETPSILPRHSSRDRLRATTLISPLLP
jgi:hypothetical protein